MKKFQLLVITFLISLSICVIAIGQVKAQSFPLAEFAVKTPGSVTAGMPFTLTVTAKDADLGTITSFSDSVDLSASPGSISPTRTGTSDWSNGVWSGSVTLTTVGFIKIFANDDSGHTGTAFLTVNVALAAPTVSASPGTVDRGQVSSLTSSVVSTGTSPYTYQWLQKAPGAGSYSAISGATSGSYSFVTSGSTAMGSWSFELQVTDAAGAVVASSAVSVTVNSALVAPSVTSAPGMITQGQVSSLTSSVVSTGTSPYTYQWLQKAPGAGSYSAISGATSGSYSFVTSGSTATGSWSFELQVTDAAGAVVASSAVSVTVNVAPTVTVSPTSWTMDVGQSKTFSATPNGGSGTYTSYQWYVGGSAQNGQVVSTFSFSSVSSGSFFITVTVTDSFGVTSVLSSAVSVTVNVAPTVTVSPTSWTMDVGQSKTFSATPNGGSGTYTSYQWYVGGSAQNGQVVSTFSFSSVSSGSFFITVTVTDSFGVSSVLSSAVSVTVNSALVAPSVTSAPGMITQGQVSSLTSSVVSTGTSPYTYQWLQKAPGAGSYSAISGATSGSYSFVTSGSTATGSWSFELQVTDAAGAVVASSAVSVTVNVAPTVTVSPTSWTMDVGQSKTFSATPNGGSGTYTSYQWYVGGSAQNGQVVSTFSFSSVSSGSFFITVTVTDSFGVSSVLSSAVSVTVNSALVVPSVSVSAVTVDRGQVSSLTSSVVSTGTSPYTYQWLQKAPGAGSYSAISGATSGSYSFVTSGSTAMGSWSFELQVTDAAGAVVASSAVSVTVNSALVAPSVTSAPGMITQGQVSSLTSSVVSTGTSPYTYQWLQKAPGGSYVTAGSNSASFSFVTSIATATGSWSFILQVKDNVGASLNSSAVSVTVNIPPLDHFGFSSVGTQIAGTSFSVTITAKDASNNTLTNYVGTNNLNVSTGTISPTSTGVFLNGVWTGLVTVTGAGSGVTLFTTGSGMYGTSAIFMVNPNVLNSFIFSIINSPQTVGSAFKITVMAKDAYGNAVIDYTGTPSLTYSAGLISPGAMNAFVNGVGSSSVTLDTPGSSANIMVTDGSHSGTSNSFTVTIAPAPIPTPTPTPTPTAISTETSAPFSTQGTTSNPKATSIPSATPSPSSTPLATDVTATTDNGTTVNLLIRGNVTSLQISNITISISESAKSTIVSFNLTGESGTTGYSNMTIPKIFVPNGTTPVVFIDGQQAANQGYTQDIKNFYVWYTTQFSKHLVKIQFPVPLTSQATSSVIVLAVAITVPEITLIYAVIAVKRLRRKPENT